MVCEELVIIVLEQNRKEIMMSARKTFCLVLAMVLSVCFLGCGKSGKKALLIFSYHPEYLWVAEESRGAEDVLKARGLTIEKFYMDTKRRTDPEWMKEKAAEAMKKIEESKPDVVIVFDDNACGLVAAKYAGKTLPFVFCGMNAEPEDYGFPAENITGVIENPPISESIEFLKRLVPDIQKGAIITDNSVTSQKLITRVKNMSFPIKIKEFYATNDFDDWKAKVKELQSKVDVIGYFVYHTVKKPGSELSLPSEQVMGWTLKNSTLPGFGTNDFSIRDGVLCGVVSCGYEQGKAAAEIAIEILGGKKPMDIPIRCPEKGKPMVNVTRAKELGIDIPQDVLDEAEIVR